VSIAVAGKIYKAMCKLQASQRWRRADNAGARFLGLIWVNSLEEPATNPEHTLGDLFIAPHTVASLSVSSLNKLLNGQYTLDAITKNSSDCDEVLASVEEKVLNVEAQSLSLQKDLAERQIKTWIMMLDMLAKKSAALVRIKHKY
jgi:hypothetical protein